MNKPVKKYFYSADMKDFNNRFEIEIKYPVLDYSVEDVAEEAADDYFHNHDSWESTWPKTFYIWNDKEEYLGASDVHVECSPSFYAYQKKEENNDQS